MNWKLSFTQKIRAAAALLLVFLLVLATNMMDNNHFAIVQRSLTTVYEDRLVAKDYIYKITYQLQLKKSANQYKDRELTTKINLKANDSIQILVDKFATTKLTKIEARHFESLQRNFNQLFQHEQKIKEGRFLNKELPSINVMENYFSAITEDLDVLSEIQMEEAKNEINYSNRAIDTSNLISRLEIGALIFIGLLIQLLIFMRPFK